MRDLQRQVSRNNAWSQGIFGEAVRFAAVGLAATLTYFVVSLLASAYALTPYWANLTGYLASVAISYFGHATVTFRSSQPHHVQGGKFLIVSVLIYGLTNLIVFVMMDAMGQGFFAAAFIVACSIPPLTWILARLWVFRAS